MFNFYKTKFPKSYLVIPNYVLNKSNRILSGIYNIFYFYCGRKYTFIRVMVFYYTGNTSIFTERNIFIVGKCINTTSAFNVLQ